MCLPVAEQTVSEPSETVSESGSEPLSVTDSIDVETRNGERGKDPNYWVIFFSYSDLFVTINNKNFRNN